MNQTDVRPNVVDANVGALDLAKLWGILVGGRWIVLGSIGLALLSSGLYLLVTPSIYRTDAVLQVQNSADQTLPGMTVLRELTGETSGTAEAELQIIRSRAVLGETVEKRNLTTKVTPNYFPIVGYAFARFRSKEPDVEENTSTTAKESKGWFTKHVWTRGTIRVDRFIVPDSLLNEEFTIRALSEKAYVLYGPDGKLLLSGQVGAVAAGQTRGGDLVEIFVSEVEPQSFPSDFTVLKQHWLEAVSDLQTQIAVKELGRDSSIMQISLEGDDAQKIRRIVNSIAETHLRQNVEARSEQAEKRLEFLDKQLPELKDDVESAETILNAYRQENRSLDLGVEARSLLDQVVKIEQRMSELELKRVELQQNYTDEHPYIAAIEDQMTSLISEKSGLESEIGLLPETEREMLGLQRDVEVNTALYLQLLNSSQELRLIKAGTVGNVRIIDRAVTPVDPVKPQILFVLIVAVLLGTFAGAAIAFARAASRSKLVDPSNIENGLGLPIYAVIPFSSWLQRESKKKQRKNGNGQIVLAKDKPDELANEALRSLRTSIHFAQKESDSSAILITGPSPEAGKSFVSMNLAVLFAEAGKTVVLVDADLRKGHLHRYLENGDPGPGLSEILSGHGSVENSTRKINDTGVTLIPRGMVPPNPSELLMRPRLKELLQKLDNDYDIVLIDAPPVLAVTDAAVISSATSGGITFLVVRSGVQRFSEVEEAVRRLARQQCEVAGVLFNGVKKSDLAENSDHGYYYQYEY